MQLRRLAALERRRLQDEYREVDRADPRAGGAARLAQEGAGADQAEPDRPEGALRRRPAHPDRRSRQGHADHARSAAGRGCVGDAFPRGCVDEVAPGRPGKRAEGQGRACAPPRPGARRSWPRTPATTSTCSASRVRPRASAPTRFPRAAAVTSPTSRASRAATGSPRWSPCPSQGDQVAGFQLPAAGHRPGQGEACRGRRSDGSGECGSAGHRAGRRR